MINPHFVKWKEVHMKALFLAGGFGTRLKPITDNLPKPMVPIMGKPLLERNIENLKRHGVNEIVLSTCYKPHMIEDYFGDGSKLGVKISYITEDKPLGTAGAIRNAGSFFSDTFLVFNADILSDIDISDMIRFHREKGAQATIAVTRVADPSAYGVIEHDGDGFVTAFKEKPRPGETTSNLINAGVYIFEPEILDEIPAGRAVSVERETYPLLLRKGYRIAVYDRCSYWMDLGTPEKYLKTHKDILRGYHRLHGVNFDRNRQYISPRSKISRTARVIGPVYIGDEVKIGPFAFIGPDTVLGDGSVVGMGAKVIGSVVWDNAYVGSGASIVDSMIMSNCRVGRNIERFRTIFTGESSCQMAV